MDTKIPSLQNVNGENSLVAFPVQVLISDRVPKPELTLVVPTRNESLAIESLLERLASCITTPTEVIFVDDSDDATAFAVRRLAENRRWGALTIRLIHRTPAQRDGGLGSAVCEGIRQSTGTWLCVLDADLQHPPEMIAPMLAHAQRQGADLVLGSRYSEGGADEGLTRGRRIVSRSCALAARVAFPRRLARVTDPLSGFFVVRREAIDVDLLHPHGFKILLEILCRSPRLRVAELGFTFSERQAGASKANVREGARFLRQLADMRLGAWKGQPPRQSSCFYDIHGILSVQSTTPLPELGKFRVRFLSTPPSINVQLSDLEPNGDTEFIDLDHVTARIRYDESFGQHGFAIEVEVDADGATHVWASPMLTHSPHVLYTNVIEPILRWKFVEQGYALVHAACFTDGTEAHMVTARTDTGKTTTMLKVLELGNYGFLSDDLTLIDRDGQAFTYPKPLTISNHTVHALQSAELDRLERFTLPLQSRLHSKSGREFALRLAEKGLAVATLNSITQRLIPPPKYHVERLVPGAQTTNTATVATLSIIQRGEDSARDLDLDSAMEILLENCEDAYGFPPYAKLEALLHGIASTDLRALEREIIRSGFRSAAARLYGSTSMGWATTINDMVVARRDQAHGRDEAVSA